jgi:hypothetical protein
MVCALCRWFDGRGTSTAAELGAKFADLVVINGLGFFPSLGHARARRAGGLSVVLPVRLVRGAVSAAPEHTGEVVDLLSEDEPHCGGGGPGCPTRGLDQAHRR